MWGKLLEHGIGLGFWLCTGGLMFVHLVLSALHQQWLLGGVGLFIPPIGLINAVSWIVSSAPITAYF